MKMHIIFIKHQTSIQPSLFQSYYNFITLQRVNMFEVVVESLLDDRCSSHTAAQMVYALFLHGADINTTDKVWLLKSFLS